MTTEKTIRIIADEKHIDKLTSAINAAQGKATARTLSADKILSVLKRVESRLDIPKKSMDGISVHYTGAETFPNAYRYTPESTHFVAIFLNRHWVVMDIYRDRCPDRENNINVQLTESAVSALVARFRSFRV